MRNTMTREGAMELARTINAYWNNPDYPNRAAYGKRLMVSVIREGLFRDNYVVRSNMIDGRPPKPHPMVT